MSPRLPSTAPNLMYETEAKFEFTTDLSARPLVLAGHLQTNNRGTPLLSRCARQRVEKMGGLQKLESSAWHFPVRTTRGISLSPTGERPTGSRCPQVFVMVRHPRESPNLSVGTSSSQRFRSLRRWQPWRHRWLKQSLGHQDLDLRVGLPVKCFFLCFGVRNLWVPKAGLALLFEV